jgi:hypothetical protein
LSVDSKSDENFQLKIRDYANMAVGRPAYSLKEEEYGYLAKQAYNNRGIAFDIKYPDLDKFPGIGGGKPVTFKFPQEPAKKKGRA